MATTTGFDSVRQAAASRLVRQPHALWWAGGASLAIFMGFFINAMMQPRMFFDVSLMKRVQAIEFPGLYDLTAFINRDLTSSTPAVVSWLVLMLVLAAARWWPAFLTAGLMPAGGLVNEFICQILVGRTRLDELVRSSSYGEEKSFPSGHVVGAVLLYGFVFVLLRRIPWRPVRLFLQAVCIGIIALVGFGRIWDGAHWPSDVLAAYPLGFAMLLAMLGIHIWLESGGLTILHRHAMRLARR
jgi:undecaprenyl-diphosphatase